MTKENRERQYKHFRNLAENYEAPEGLNKGITATQLVRAHMKECSDAMLVRNPELEETTKPVPEVKSKEKVKDAKK